MTPKERFARLNDRVMAASERGDSATVLNFTPMALGAYSQLDTVDTDSRYHAAILQAQIGEFTGALALADTILKDAPGNLFGYVVRGTVAQLQNDGDALARARQDFLRHYDVEITKQRVEYLDHRQALEDFRQAATSGKR